MYHGYGHGCGTKQRKVKWYAFGISAIETETEIEAKISLCTITGIWIFIFCRYTWQSFLLCPYVGVGSGREWVVERNMHMSSYWQFQHRKGYCKKKRKKRKEGKQRKSGFDNCLQQLNRFFLSFAIDS